MAESPGGYVVVLFGDGVEGCPLSHCPMGSVEWFRTKEQADDHCKRMPAAFEPHILIVHRDYGPAAGGG